MAEKGVSAAQGLIGGLVTIIVALIGAYATMHANRPQPAAPRVPVEPAADHGQQPRQLVEPARNLSDLYEPQLKNAVDLASAAIVEATRQLNPQPLYQIFKGAALKLQIANIDAFRNNGVFAVAQRPRISYGDITVNPDERHARVHATPVWDLTFYSIMNQQCVGRLPAREMPQTIDLEASDGGWIITAVVMEDNAVPPLQPCY